MLEGGHHVRGRRTGPIDLIACDRRYLVSWSGTGHATSLAGMLISVLCEIYRVNVGRRYEATCVLRVSVLFVCYRLGDTNLRCIEADYSLSGYGL